MQEVARAWRLVRQGAPAEAICQVVAARAGIPATEFTLLVATYGEWGGQAEVEWELLQGLYERQRMVLPRKWVLRIEARTENAERRRELVRQIRRYEEEPADATVDELQQKYDELRAREIAPLIRDTLATALQYYGVRMTNLRRRLLQEFLTPALRWVGRWNAGLEIALAVVTAVGEEGNAEQ